MNLRAGGGTGAVATVHPTAIVADGAALGAGTVVGPYCVIGPEVTIGEGGHLASHVVIDGRTKVGARVRVFPFASLGQPPQDLKHRGEPTDLVIGDDCMIREGVTMNTGTVGGGGITRVGNRSVFLSHSHVAHDCEVGDEVILSNNVMLAGHVKVGDRAILGGGAAVHQFARIGAQAFVGGLAGVEHDVIPFGMALGNRAHLAGINIVGLRRSDVPRERQHELRRAYKILFSREGTLQERVATVASEFERHPEVSRVLDFIREGGDRALCTPRDGKD